MINNKKIHTYNNNKILNKNIEDNEEVKDNQTRQTKQNKIEECNNIYKNCIKNQQIEIIKHSNNFLNMDHTKETLKIGYKLVNNIKEILYYNKIFTDLLKNITDTCDNFINDIENNLFNYNNNSVNSNSNSNINNSNINNSNNSNINNININNKNIQENQNETFTNTYDERSIYLPLEEDEDEFIFVYNKYKKNLYNEQKEIKEEKQKKEKISIKNNKSKIFIKEIGYEMNIEKVENLTDIKSMFYWYEGDEKYDPGIYCSPYFNTYIKVPFPKIIDINKEVNKSTTICCKYITKEECNRQKNKYDTKYYNEKSCQYVHKGETITKIGITARCQKMPDFGNPSSLTDDLYDINLQDMKTILLYGINDSFLMSIWLDYNIKYKKINKHNTIVLDNLDKFV